MIDLPAPLQEALVIELERLEGRVQLRGCTPVSGGCIHNACRLDTSRGAYMLKWNPAPLPEIFTAEKHGLDLLRSTGTVHVPIVFAAVEPQGERPAYILMEFIQPPPAGQAGFDQASLGEQLATLHRSPPAQAGERYGLDRNNFIGRLPQINSWRGNWVEFFLENRLLPQVRFADENGLLSPGRRQRLNRIMERLDTWLGGTARRPSLLHGDLWAGNVISGPGGVPVLLDPAVYYGDREIDLAFTEMFGGFSARFYQAYQQAWSLEAGYDARKPLYCLYHQLNHLNHFGESYGPGIDRTLARFV